jgi:hypothetical protein
LAGYARLSSPYRIFLVWYGYTLAIVYREELLFLAHFIRCSFACDSKGGDEAVGLT